ncbi:hypothetical protein [Plantactinospora sonchi]|uniref:DUF5709 domain-containing protein n=1 Tax=Plantactinospora sonchi TaxID=1544735 RepID=A0ABU7RU03_9ACTN
MTDHWGGWPSDQPDFDGPDEHTADGPLGGFDHDDGFHRVDGFDPDEPAEGFGAADPYDDPGAHEQPDGDGGVDPYAGGGGGHPGGEVGFGSADPYAETGFGAADPVDGHELTDPPVGADPDLGPYDDPASWPVVDPTLVDGLGPPPEPVDGFPWTDPDLLGRPEDVPSTDPVAVSGPAPDPDELAAYAAERLPADGDPWSALAASEDPATSNLARFWHQPEDR